MEDIRITNMQHSVPELNYECTLFFFVLFCLGTEVSMGVGRQYILYGVCDEHFVYSHSI